jgi:uncharacterized membrane protein YdfJ with MMPL/SSD domain
MIQKVKLASRLSQKTSWRMIMSTAFAAVICWLAALAMLRGVVAQNAESVPPKTETNEEEVVSRRVLPQADREAESPEFRDSADNNVSFPVDI